MQSDVEEMAAQEIARGHMNSKKTMFVILMNSFAKQEHNSLKRCVTTWNLGARIDRNVNTLLARHKAETQTSRRLYGMKSIISLLSVLNTQNCKNALWRCVTSWGKNMSEELEELLNESEVRVGKELSRNHSVRLYNSMSHVMSQMMAATCHTSLRHWLLKTREAQVEVARKVELRRVFLRKLDRQLAIQQIRQILICGE